MALSHNAAKKAAADLGVETVYDRASISDYINAAGRKNSPARAERINELATALGTARRTVERWATEGEEQRSPSRKYQVKLAELNLFEPRTQNPERVTIKFEGTVTVSQDTRFRKNVKVELSGEEVQKFYDKAVSYSPKKTPAYDSDGEPNEPGEYLLAVYGSGGRFSSNDVRLEVS